MNDFGKRLIKWYQQNKRVLPWRETKDPYTIWLSEIILQQTRVSQGLPYFQRFLEKYPTVVHLAGAPQNEVFKLWQGLGYYRRAENMMKAAKIIVEEFNGVFPITFPGLKKLPGVGDYTAAAIASIAYGEKIPVVDGNVYRVLSRVFGIKTIIQTSRAKDEFGQIMRSLMEEVHPGTFNEAVMEFGALQCVPANPRCEACVFSPACFALNQQVIQEFPVVKPKIKKRRLFIYYLVVKWGKRLIVRHRRENEIWKGLYDFPSLEFTEEQEESKVMREIDTLELFSPDAVKVITSFSKRYKHQLTHIDIMARFIQVELKRKPNIESDETLCLIASQTLQDLAVSRLVEKFLVEEGIVRRRQD